MSFKSDISKFKLQTLKKIERTRKGATFRLFAAVIRDTPVGHPDTWNMTEAQKNAVKKSGYTGGSLRNSWICTQNAPASGVRDSEDDGAEADALVLARQEAAAPQAREDRLVGAVAAALRHHDNE